VVVDTLSDGSVVTTDGTSTDTNLNSPDTPGTFRSLQLWRLFLAWRRFAKTRAGAYPKGNIFPSLPLSATGSQEQQLARRTSAGLPSASDSTITEFLPHMKWNSKGPKCVFDSINIGFGKMVSESYTLPTAGRNTVKYLRRMLPAGHGLQELTKFDSGGNRQPAVGALRQAMNRPMGRFLVLYQWERRDDNGVYRRDTHALVVNCDAREVWCNVCGRVPFNNSADATVPESFTTRKQVQVQLESSNGGVLAIYRFTINMDSLSWPGAHPVDTMAAVGGHPPQSMPVLGSERLPNSIETNRKIDGSKCTKKKTRRGKRPRGYQTGQKKRRKALKSIEDSMAADIANARLQGYTSFCYLRFWTMESIREMLTGGMELRKTATKAELTILATRWPTDELLEVLEKWPTAANTEVWHLGKGGGGIGITIEKLIDIMPGDGLVGMERATDMSHEERTHGTSTGREFGSNRGCGDGNTDGGGDGGKRRQMMKPALRVPRSARGSKPKQDGSRQPQAQRPEPTRPITTDESCSMSDSLTDFIELETHTAAEGEAGENARLAAEEKEAPLEAEHLGLTAEAYTVAARKRQACRTIHARFVRMYLDRAKYALARHIVRATYSEHHAPRTVPLIGHSVRVPDIEHSETSSELGGAVQLLMEYSLGELRSIVTTKAKDSASMEQVVGICADLIIGKKLNVQKAKVFNLVDIAARRIIRSGPMSGNTRSQLLAFFAIWIFKAPQIIRWSQSHINRAVAHKEAYLLAVRCERVFDFKPTFLKLAIALQKRVEFAVPFGGLKKSEAIKADILKTGQTLAEAMLQKVVDQGRHPQSQVSESTEVRSTFSRR
jgi:hypothetical protein